MTTVASYLMGIPPGNTNTEKPAIIVNFIEGVWRCGDEGSIVTDYNPISADVAVVQGFVHPGSKNAPHLKLRKDVFEKQQRENKRSIIVDSNLFLYADPKNTRQYLRYSYDGIFPTTGEYCNNEPDPERWVKLSRELKITMKPWKLTKGKHILITCQRDGGWSMDGQAIMPWLLKTIKEIRKWSDRPIRIRFHPGDKKVLEHKRALARYRLPGVGISHFDNILQDFVQCHAIISYNSSPAVAAAIEGVPVFLLDPKRSQAKDVAHHHLKDLEYLQEFDRHTWSHSMAQMHWTLTELKDGTAWKHLRQWSKK